MSARTIALIGCGRWGHFILRDLVALGADVHVVSPSAASRAGALAQGARAASAGLGELGRVDGVVVATPTVTHADVIEDLLPLGCPIFVEKPLASSVERARAVVAQAGERIFVMDKWRYHPGVVRLAALAREGAFGRLHAIRLQRLGWHNPHVDVDAAWILLPHDLSISLHILGRLPPVSFARSLCREGPDRAVLAVLEDDAGPPVTIEISIVSPENRRSCTVVGERLTAQLTNSYDEALLLRHGAPGAQSAEASTLMCDGKLPLLAELERFLGYLDGGPPPDSTAADGLLIVERLAEIRRLAGME